MKPREPSGRPPSLADFLVRPDLRALAEEARSDYSEAISGTPRLLEQSDIAARFRKARNKPPEDSNERT